MEKKNIYIHIFNALLIAAAYGYLLYKLITFKDYAMMAESFSQATFIQYGALILALLLMPLNIFLEAVKWRALQRNVESMTLADANRQVYYGYVGGFVTPYRAGDFPARVMLMKDRTKWPAAVGMGLVGMVALLLVEAVLGMPACYFLASYESSVGSKSVFLTMGGVVLLLLVATIVVKCLAKCTWRQPKLQELFAALQTITLQHFLYIVLLSLIRYVLWSFQLVLVLYFCGVELTLFEIVLTVPAYYMLVGFMPSLPVADMAIRGSWSILTFGVFSPNTAGIALAAIIVWMGNTILPMLVGTWIKKNITPDK